MEDFIQGKELTLSAYIEILLSKNSSKLHPNNHFPTDELLNEFLKTINERSDREIRSILRKFIIHSCTFRSDEFRASNIIARIKDRKISNVQIDGRMEYDRRLLQYCLKNNCEVWEGLTWTLDLLPHFPKEAIKAIDAYFLANCQMLPDEWLNALSDCKTIIRARYINYNHPNEIYWNLEPKGFEFLIAELYERLEYSVTLTKDSYDGGVDVLAVKNEVSLKEKLVIQCKRYTKATIGVKDIRNLLGVVSDSKATKGVLITTSKFSHTAEKFAKDNPSIELINLTELNKLLNANLGTYWVNKIDNIITNQKANKVPRTKKVCH